MGMMFDVKYLQLQQNLVHLNTAMVELQQFAVHKTSWHKQIRMFAKLEQTSPNYHSLPCVTAIESEIWKQL